MLLFMNCCFCADKKYKRDASFTIRQIMAFVSQPALLPADFGVALEPKREEPKKKPKKSKSQPKPQPKTAKKKKKAPKAPKKGRKLPWKV